MWDSTDYSQTHAHYSLHMHAYSYFKSRDQGTHTRRPNTQTVTQVTIPLLGLCTHVAASQQVFLHSGFSRTSVVVVK